MPMTTEYPASKEKLKLRRPDTPTRPLSALWALARKNHASNQRAVAKAEAQKIAEQEAKAAENVKFAWD